MPDFRAYAVPAEDEPAEIRLSPEESHHLINVNRARAGDPVVAFNGRGHEWSCTLSRADKRAAHLQVHAQQVRPPLPYALTLAQALPKGAHMDAIVRKATEIGVHRIVPIETERTQVHLDADRGDRKLEKWQTAALEACKQCGNPWLPEISPLQSLGTLLATSSSYDLKLIASLHAGARALRQILAEVRGASSSPPRHVLWLIGPEGDFSHDELARAAQAGFAPVTLGPLVLRCETAAVYALSITSYELQVS